MNAFPDDFIAHNLPLVVLSGLGDEPGDSRADARARNILSEGGFRIKTDVPPVEGSTAEALRQALLSLDARERPWHTRGIGQAEQNAVFRLQSIGRAYTLPPRKAPPPPHSPRLRPANDGTSPPPQLVLHSPLSPLTPSSPLYPDGIATPLWISKHQSRLPSLFISFFTLVSDANTSTLRDNKLKSEINNIRSVLTSTSYKTRLIIVLIGESEVQASEAEERLTNIRRATSLDSRSIFYLAAGLPQNEVFEFSRGLLNSLYAGCLEYYRDLSKHARRKRSRSVAPQPTIPPSSGTLRTLLLAGWNVRYEFKLAVFAEFRQEMEAALRNYESAYEGLFSADVFETIPSWSPRFNETRTFADIIAIRIIRCVLWLGQTTNAVKWWTDHRNRTRALLDRRGVGTESYGWEAWQSIWSRTMADLVQRAQVLLPSEKNVSSPPFTPLFIDAEKTLPATQRYTPWESLHHEGYWLNLAQRYTQNRRTKALRIPEEDRAAPGQSPASVTASKSHLYDKHMVPEPYREVPLDDKNGFDYSGEILQVLDAAVRQFSDRGQANMAEILQIKKAVELMKSGSWDEALYLLRAVWERQAWRRSGWWLLVEQIGQGLLGCAREAGNHELVAQLQWQLTHPLLDRSKGEEDDMESIQESSQSQAALDTEHALTRLLPGFAFATEEGHVGEPMDIQISLRHLESSHAVNFQLIQVKIVFEGGLKPVYLMDDRDEIIDESLQEVTITEIKLDDARSKPAAAHRSSIGAAAGLGADVNLGLRSGYIKVYQAQVIPREAGDVSVASISMTFKRSGREMTITASNLTDTPGQWWEMRQGKPSSRSCGRQRSAATARVLPKPPKVQIRLPNMPKAFYTDESITITVECENQEEQAILGSLQAKLISPGKNNAIVQWADEETVTASLTSDAVAFVQSLPPRGVDDMQVGAQSTHKIIIRNTDEAIDHEMELLMNYHLLSSPDTILTKVHTIDIPIIRPFEANFSFHARLHEEAWPNFFSKQSISRDAERATGIKQRYLITAVICSFATEHVVIESARLVTQKIVGGATCSVTAGFLRRASAAEGIRDTSDETTSIVVHPEETRRFGFEMTIQKSVLGDRQPVAVDVLLEIVWKRQDAAQVNTSTLQVPRFLAPSTEPRVLLRLTKADGQPGLCRLDYTLENPSLHFLTFNLTMESSNDFAFSGIKSKSLSLVPISRHDIVYRILPNKSKAWIKVQLEVVDAYFGQTLRIQAASDGIRVDKQGNVSVYID